MTVTPNWSIIRRDFPILDQEVDGHPLAYLDSAASSQMPRQAIDRLAHHQLSDHSNIHRGLHALSLRSTDYVEDVRKKLGRLLNSPAKQIVFTRGTTESINLVVSSMMLDPKLAPGEGDNVVLSVMEHHANIVPWVMRKNEAKFEIRVVDFKSDEDPLNASDFLSKIDDRTRFVAFTHVSNTLGTVNDVKTIVESIREKLPDIPILVDGCQAPLHLTIDVTDLDVDFYALSAHKMVGPTGIGLLYAKKKWLERLEPLIGGGDMILSVDFDAVRYAAVPTKFEGGTLPILAIIGWGESLDYLHSLMPVISNRDKELGQCFLERLADQPNIRLLGPKTMENRAAIFSLDFNGVHPHDVGTILASRGVAVRAGHHCTQPLMKRLGVSATTRASLIFYNNEDDIDRFFEATKSVWEIFA